MNLMQVPIAYMNRLIVYSVILAIAVASSRAEECPPWFTLEISNNSVFPQCVCSDAQDSVVTCNQRERASYIKIGHCANQVVALNTTVVASVPYVFPLHLIHNGFIRLPHNVSDINTFTCGNLRRETGSLLCGKCINGTGPSIYSVGSQCTECSRANILYYLLLQYAPTTIIFLAILLFRCSIVSPPMSHYILYCNLVQYGLKTGLGQYALFATTDMVHVVIKVMLTLNYILSLDPLYLISPPLCISDKLPAIYVPMLDMIAALYPFTLVLLTYILIELHARDCKPIVAIWKISKCSKMFSSWNSGSLIQVFATLFFLSFIKLIGVSVELTFTTYVINIQNKVVARVSYIDPTVLVFSGRHLPIILLFTTVVSLFVLPPILLLILYPTSCFRKVSIYLKPRWLLAIKIFTDTFHGSFKDGTNGTRDYRPMAGFIFLTWILFPILIAVRISITITWRLFMLPLLIASIISLVVLEPYKHREHTVAGTLLAIATTGAIIACILDFYYFSVQVALLGIVVLTLPHCVFYGYGIYRLIKRVKRYAIHVSGEEESMPLILS